MGIRTDRVFDGVTRVTCLETEDGVVRVFGKTSGEDTASGAFHHQSELYMTSDTVKSLPPPTIT